MKAESHKGKNSDEVFLINLYYNNKIFFSTLVVGSEACTVVLYVVAKVAFFQTYVPTVALSAILSMIMATKMLVNVFQWYGGFKRILKYDEDNKTNTSAY